MADKERRQVPSSGCLSSQLVKEVPVFILSWTSELAPIKQSGAAMYLLIWTVLLTAVALLLLRWLDTKGADAFAAL